MNGYANCRLNSSLCGQDGLDRMLYTEELSLIGWIRHRANWWELKEGRSFAIETPDFVVGLPDGPGESRVADAVFNSALMRADGPQCLFQDTKLNALQFVVFSVNRDLDGRFEVCHHITVKTVGGGFDVWMVGRPSSRFRLKGFWSRDNLDIVN